MGLSHGSCVMQGSLNTGAIMGEVMGEWHWECPSGVRLGTLLGTLMCCMSLRVGVWVGVRCSNWRQNCGECPQVCHEGQFIGLSRN